MYRLEREDFVKTPYLYLWALLAFQAGYINAFGFLACGRYVSHVTGFGTQIGTALAHAKPLLAFELLGFPLFFIFGAFVNGTLTAARIEAGKKPHFQLVAGLSVILLLALILLGAAEVFSHFADMEVEAPDFLLLFILSFTCGMQNGCYAVLTKGQIRTTHLTGISTDIGTDLARLSSGKLSAVEYQLTHKTNLCRISTFFAFASGSVISVSLSQTLEYYALAVPLLTSVVAYFSLLMIKKILDQRFPENQPQELTNEFDRPTSSELKLKSPFPLED